MAYVKSESINHWTVLRFNADRLTDPMTVSEISRELDVLIAKLPLRGQVAVNFAGVAQVSSQVIGLLLGLRDQVNKKHGRLVLCKLGKQVIDVMRITRLDRHFEFSDSVSAIVGKRSTATAGGGNDVAWMD
jgi:anti-sigma B factor antagonist